MKLTPKEQKLILLALDRAAHPGEADNAAAALLRLLGARFGDGYRLLEELEGPPPTSSATQRFKPGADYGTTVLPFGKYKGRELRGIPVDYLLWVSRTCSNLNPLLREALTRYLRDKDFS